MMMTAAGLPSRIARRLGLAPKPPAPPGFDEMLSGVGLDAARAQALHDYVGAMSSVQGWFCVEDALAMARCLAVQEAEGVTGAVAEIGVHHGKSFLALACSARPSEALYAIDVFERQDLNVDRSGSGSRSAFLRNIERHRPSADVRILAMSSLDLRGREAELTGPLRFLSIDGGHTAAITCNDLEIANAALVEGGACCVDDIFHHEWTGVISGVFAFLALDRPLWPFALLPKKLYFCRPADHERRRAQFREALGAFLLRPDQEFGSHQVDSYRPFPT